MIWITGPGLVFSDCSEIFHCEVQRIWSILFRYWPDMVMSMCGVISCVVGRGCLLWLVCSLDRSLLAFALLHFNTPRPNVPIVPGIYWLPAFAFQFPMIKRTSFFFFFWCSRRSCGTLCNCSTSASSALVVGAWIQMTGMLNRFALETNWDHFVAFEIALKYCISSSFVDCEVYSISSKGFFPHGHLNWIHSFPSILVFWFLKCLCSLLPFPGWTLLIYLDAWT